MFIYHLLIDASISGSNNQNPMLAFHEENTVLLNNKCQGILKTTMLKYLVFIDSILF